MRTRARRLVRFARLVVGHERIPRWLKWCMSIALLPIPGPIDEAVLVFVVVALVAFRRSVLVDSWRASA